MLTEIAEVRNEVVFCNERSLGVVFFYVSEGGIQIIDRLAVRDEGAVIGLGFYRSRIAIEERSGIETQIFSADRSEKQSCTGADFDKMTIGWLEFLDIDLLVVKASKPIADCRNCLETILK